MLISLSKKFVFVANLKSASTAIEKALRPHAELALVESRFGKHQSFREIEARFAWLLDQIDPRERLVFGVLRDPIDYVISLYNSHQDSKFADRPGLTTSGLSFEQFLSEWTVRNPDQIRQQYLRFVDRSGRLGVNYLIAYERLDDALRFVGERIGVRGLVPLSRENESPATFKRASLTSEHVDWIEERFAQDRKVLNEYCNYLLPSRPILTDGDTGAIAERADLPAVPPQAAGAAPAAGAVGGTRTAAGEAIPASQLVRGLYRALLLREPDSHGLATRVGQLRDGRPVETVVGQLLRSPEFAQKHSRFYEQYVDRPSATTHTAGDRAAVGAAAVEPADFDFAIFRNEYGIYCVPRSSMHRPAAQAIIAGRVWEKETIDCIASACAGGDIVHAGAYFGDFLPALSRAATDSIVWAFEPNPENHRCAAITVLLNDLRNVNLVSAALGGERRSAALITRTPDGHALGGASHLAPSDASGDTATLVVTVDEVVPADRYVTVLQLDVEHAEEAALSGAIQTIIRCRPLIILESVPRDWIGAHLSPLGYRLAGKLAENVILRPEERN